MSPLTFIENVCIGSLFTRKKLFERIMCTCVCVCICPMCLHMGHMHTRTHTHTLGIKIDFPNSRYVIQNLKNIHHSFDKPITHNSQPMNHNENNEYEMTITRMNKHDYNPYNYAHMCEYMDFFQDYVCTSMIIYTQISHDGELVFPSTLKKLVIKTHIMNHFVLPDNLEYFEYDGTIEHPITLPNKLCYLSIGRLYASLKFPDTLEELFLGNGTAITLTLPKRLKKLICTVTDECLIIPESVTHLVLWGLGQLSNQCSGQHILDNLPSGLKTLKLSCNYKSTCIYHIDNIPNNLIGLHIDDITIANIRTIRSLSNIKYFYGAQCKLIKSDCPKEIIDAMSQRDQKQVFL